MANYVAKVPTLEEQFQSNEETRKKQEEIKLQLEDNELKCNICYEVFKRPTVLNCKHTFCQWCIHTWWIRFDECPNCRETITSEEICLTTQNHIKNLVMQMPQEFQDTYINTEQTKALDNEKNSSLRAYRQRIGRIAFELNTNYFNNITNLR